MMRPYWMILAAVLAAACARASRSPSITATVEGRCFLYSRATGAWTSDAQPLVGTWRIRLTARAATDAEFAGWRVVEPGIGRRFTYWTPNGADSVRIVFSDDVMDATWMRLAVTGNTLAGTSEVASDMVTTITITGLHGDTLPHSDSLTILRRTRCGEE
ncbi:MAG TPA: hypothetical protein VFJ16_08705 [Longimicrobium sp.]|nr:hypothetical protein [Longimicrobium sp.]